MVNRRAPKIRVIVRPWIPKGKIPHIPQETIQETMNTYFEKLKPVIYVGWSMRKYHGKRLLLYLMATGNTSKEARSNFKKNEDFGQTIWDLSGVLS